MHKSLPFGVAAEIMGDLSRRSGFCELINKLDRDVALDIIKDIAGRIKDAYHRDEDAT